MNFSPKISGRLLLAFSGQKHGMERFPMADAGNGSKLTKRRLKQWQKEKMTN